MTIEQLKENCKCCSCEEPLAKSDNLNMVQIQKPAKWKFPIWGNFITKQSNMACAYICDPCYDAGMVAQKPVLIRFAVETTDTEIIYHPIESL